MISEITLPGFKRGIDVFEEKPDLLPFEEAKLYGHNATHALLGYLIHEQGRQYMSEAPEDLVYYARDAFLHESGAALIKKYQGLDPLFTEKGFTDYVDDLINRMMNPWLRDQVARVIRDPERKLGWDDRLIGTLRLCIAQNVEAPRFVQGILTALKTLDSALDFPWEKPGQSKEEQTAVRERILAGKGHNKAFQKEENP